MIVARTRRARARSEGLAGGEAATGKGEDDAEERPRRACTKRARGGDEVRVDRLEGGDRLADVQRARHVRDRDDDGRLGQA